jgi:hypothetical protein
MQYNAWQICLHHAEDGPVSAYPSLRDELPSVHHLALPCLAVPFLFSRGQDILTPVSISVFK